MGLLSVAWSARDSATVKTFSRQGSVKLHSLLGWRQLVGSNHAWHYGLLERDS